MTMPAAFFAMCVVNEVDQFALAIGLAAISGQSEILSRVGAELFDVRKGGAAIGFRLPASRAC